MQIHDDPEVVSGGVPRVERQRPEHGLEVARAVADAGATPASVFELQRLAGNASVSRLLSRSVDEEAEGGTQRSPVLDVVGKGGGQPLEPTLRREMEGRLGADFGNVRVHTDPAASESAKAVDANAYTVGSDVVFRSERWNPDSTDGKTTLAHELTHVVQQSNGPVSGTSTGAGIRVSDPSDSFEQAADATARAAIAGAPPAALSGAAAGAQREAADETEDEETTQGQFVQREGAPGEEDELEDEETTQGQFVQREGAPGEEDELEDEETTQGQFVQREGAPGEEDLEEEKDLVKGG